jgi:hypothetical protein
MSEASDKLAQTRLAIVAHIQRRDRRSTRDDTRQERLEGIGAQEQEAWDEADDHGGGPAAWFSHFKHAARSWWRQHPAHLGVELATPMLSKFARQKPVQFLGIAAAVGAVVVIARPWRLISLTGLIVALVKSSQLSSMLMSAMSAADFQKDHQRPPYDPPR